MEKQNKNYLCQNYLWYYGSFHTWLLFKQNMSVEFCAINYVLLNIFHMVFAVIILNYKNLMAKENVIDFMECILIVK